MRGCKAVEKGQLVLLVLLVLLLQPQVCNEREDRRDQNSCRQTRTSGLASNSQSMLPSHELRNDSPHPGTFRKTAKCSFKTQLLHNIEALVHNNFLLSNSSQPLLHGGHVRPLRLNWRSWQVQPGWGASCAILPATCFAKALQQDAAGKTKYCG